MPSFREDKDFEERFIPHVREILPQLVFVPVAPAEEDFKHNTDYGLVVDVESFQGNMLRVSSRIRRAAQAKKRDEGGHPFTREFTIRYSRPSGHQTEMAKMSAGHGQVMLYGFESEPGSDRLDPWIILGLDQLRQHDPRGNRWRRQYQNKDRSSSFVVYWLEDIPRPTLLRSHGIPRALVGSIEAAKTDSRYAPYARPDYWAETSAVHPDPKSDTGWLCPRCGRSTTVFYGQGPTFDPRTRRYDGPDGRTCWPCFDSTPTTTEQEEVWTG